MIETIASFFSDLAQMSLGIPTFVMVPLVMLLATIGTTVIVGLILGLIRLVFGQKAIDFIKSIPQRLDHAAHANRS